MKKPSLITIIGIVVVLVVGVIYFAIQGQADHTPASSGGLLTSDTGVIDPAVAETLSVLSQVTNPVLTIDTSFFTKASYLGLVDRTKTINGLPWGDRKDVFAPVSGLPSIYAPASAASVPATP